MDLEQMKQQLNNLNRRLDSLEEQNSSLINRIESGRINSAQQRLIKQYRIFSCVGMMMPLVIIIFYKDSAITYKGVRRHIFPHSSDNGRISGKRHKEHRLQHHGRSDCGEESHILQETSSYIHGHTDSHVHTADCKFLLRDGHRAIYSLRHDSRTNNRARDRNQSISQHNEKLPRANYQRLRPRYTFLSNIALMEPMELNTPEAS